MTIELSTYSVPEEERLAFWKDIVSQNLTNAHIETIGSEPFSGRMHVARTGLVSAGLAETSGHFANHRHTEARDIKDHVVILQAILDGQAEYLCDNRRVVAGAGEVMILDSAHAGDILIEEGYRVAVLTLPRHLVIPHFTSSETINAALSDLQRGLPTQLLHDFVLGVTEPEARETYSVGAIIQTTGGLLSMALDHLKHGTWGEERGLAGARRAAIRSYMLHHSTDTALTPASVAEEFKISVRYLHKLVSETGRTFREELQHIRLQAVWRALNDPRQNGRPISDIAYSAGFNDLSSFNRSFRAAYGMTPKEARNAIG